jgi:hypothetical protein
MCERLDQVLPTDDVPLASQGLDPAVLGQNIG